jgi:hypothetical protein
MYFKYSDLEWRSFNPIKYWAAIKLIFSLTSLLNEYFCHSLNSTSNQVESDKVLSRTTTHPPTSETFKALPDKLGGWFSVCNLILTQLERRPQKKWRQPQKINKNEDDLKKKLKNEDDLKKNEDNLNLKKMKMKTT